MTQGNGMFLFITGLILAMLGVGGVEGSLDNAGLVTGMVVALVGCAVAACGVMMINQAEERS